MFNSLENFALYSITLITFIFLIWGYNRAKKAGKIGILSWLQSVTFTIPWIVFFSLFALGISLNFIGIIGLLVISSGAYIYLGNRLRKEVQNQVLNKVNPSEIELNQLLSNLKNLEDNPNSNPAEINLNKPQILTEIKSEFTPINEEDLATIKTIFSVDTFFAIETIAYQEGAIFRGNLRENPDIAHQKLTAKLQSKFEDKYRLFLVETPDSKPVVIVLPSSNDPQPSTLAQKNLALVLFLATIFTTFEGMSLLQGFDLFTDWSRYRESIPLTLGLWIILIGHEIGHRVVAKRYNLRLSLPFYLPNLQLGSFGAITRFESLLPHRTALFDVAFGGCAVGAIISLLMLIIGLSLSGDSSIFQIPSQFFQGSILIGFLAKLILGDVLKTTIINIHPLAVLGWLGLVITALNLLPAGQLDGGRIIQAIYGRKIARITSILTLVILGIVSIANINNSIPFYWAIVILFLQRDLERPSLNELTEPNDQRAIAALLTLVFVLLILIPLSPSLALKLGIGSL